MYISQYWSQFPSLLFLGFLFYCDEYLATKQSLLRYIIRQTRAAISRDSRHSKKSSRAPAATTIHTACWFSNHEDYTLAAGRSTIAAEATRENYLLYSAWFPVNYERAQLNCVPLLVSLLHKPWPQTTPCVRISDRRAIVVQCSRSLRSIYEITVQQTLI
jgi:hypothetical protein